jgi:16S rRNA (adenine1518-N6/adenine1519-N6)-dimethyltransferase
MLAVELDRGLHGFLEQRFATELVTTTASGERRFTLVHGDCLASKSRLHPAIEAFAAAPWRLGANLPYDVALPVILNAAALPIPPERVAVTIQYEAAERLCARPGADAWGASAAVLQAAGMPKLVRKLGPSCFHPQPRVDSAVLAWEPRTALPTGFGRWCRTVFAARRKVLTRALRDAGSERDAAEAACQACGLDPARRLEQLDAPELLALFRALGLVPEGTDDA